MFILYVAPIHALLFIYLRTYLSVISIHLLLHITLYSFYNTYTMFVTALLLITAATCFGHNSWPSSGS